MNRFFLLSLFFGICLAQDAPKLEVVPLSASPGYLFSLRGDLREIGQVILTTGLSSEFLTPSDFDVLTTNAFMTGFPALAKPGAIVTGHDFESVPPAYFSYGTNSLQLISGVVVVPEGDVTYHLVVRNAASIRPVIDAFRRIDRSKIPRMRLPRPVAARPAHRNPLVWSLIAGSTIVALGILVLTICVLRRVSRR